MVTEMEKKWLGFPMGDWFIRQSMLVKSFRSNSKIFNFVSKEFRIFSRLIQILQCWHPDIKPFLNMESTQMLDYNTIQIYIKLLFWTLKSLVLSPLGPSLLFELFISSLHLPPVISHWGPRVHAWYSKIKLKFSKKRIISIWIYCPRKPSGCLGFFGQSQKRVSVISAPI